MSGNRKQFIFLFLTNFFFFMGYNSMNILPAYLASEGAGSGLVGLFHTVPVLMLVLLVFIQLIRGRSFHKLRVVRVGFLCSIVAGFGMFYFRGRLLPMFGFFLLTGITYGAGFTNLFSMMYDIVDPEKRRSSAALFGISGMMTTGIASAVAQQIYAYDPAGIFFLPVLFTGIAFLLSMTLKPGHYTLMEKETFSWQRFRRMPGMGRLIYQSIVFGGGFGIFKTFIPLFTEHRLGTVDITRFFGFFTLVGIVYRLIFVRWMDRFSHKKVLVAGYLLMLTSLLGLGWIDHLYQLYLLGAFYGLAHSFLFPTFSAEYVRIGGPHRAAYNNLFLAFFSGGMTLSASLLGSLGDLLGLGSIPYAMGGLLLIAIISLLPRRNPSHS